MQYAIMLLVMMWAITGVGILFTNYHKDPAPVITPNIFLKKDDCGADHDQKIRNEDIEGIVDFMIKNKDFAVTKNGVKYDFTNVSTNTEVSK